MDFEAVPVKLRVIAFLGLLFESVTFPVMEYEGFIVNDKYLEVFCGVGEH